ncbi:MAG TPA: T9SS type A sorting domain-containing protein [Ignavibacteria bacterium]|nr:T9SS type A sorting domain-containing protein [Ignavibacteria bacterium]HMR00096.1 T9SS type A sorting domain-containing protein [Ignavibacteria bacterium]
MKKIFLAFALILVSSYTFSQGFTFTRVGPETITITDTNAFEGYIEAILNPNSGSQDIRVIRIIEDLTPSWQPLGTAICNYQSCFPPDTDTVTASYSSATNADDILSFHFYCRTVENVFVQGAGHMRIRAELVSNPSQYIELDFRANTSQTIGITNISSVANEFSLSQNYPNPFNPNTKINFSIPKSDYVSLRVYDMLGREVSVLVNGQLTAGEYQADFNAKGLSSGMYYYSLRAGEYVDVKKMVLVK